MTKLFVHHIWFRLLSPFFSGILVYFLILLINDSVLYIQEDFLTQELYVCIGLAYVTQEFSRWCLIIFGYIKRPKSFFPRILIQLVCSIALTILLVSLAIYFYFKYVLLYTPNFRELYIFNSIYSFITFLYLVLYLGHYFLHKRNIKKLEKEELARIAIEAEFQSYKKGVNPDLLFESLEAMLVTMKKDAEKAEALADEFSTVYRYILSKRNRELVSLGEELTVLDSLSSLFNQLPYRKVSIENHSDKDIPVIPATLLSMVESIIRSTIATEKNSLKIIISEVGEDIQLKYQPEERLNRKMSLETVSNVVYSYQYYSKRPIQIVNDGKFKLIKLPKLKYHEGSHT